MVTLDLQSLNGKEKQSCLQSVIGPRPIALVSTIDESGNVNLSPFSFFNVFSIDPPICIFSPSRRLRDNTVKHTLENIRQVAECVINIVNYDMVQQTSLASCEYPAGVNEFVKAGFTMIASVGVRPPRVAESPAQLECRVLNVISLGETAGAGNLVLAQVDRVHLHESVLDPAGVPDPARLDLVARLGGDWYARISPNSLFEVVKPNSLTGMGFDRLPDWVMTSPHLTNNERAQLANIPAPPEVDPDGEAEVRRILSQVYDSGLSPAESVVGAIRHFLKSGQIRLAWVVIRLKSDGVI